MNVNSIVLVGRLVNDPELTTIGGDKPTSKAAFKLAVNRSTDKTDFIPIEVFGAQAENCKKYLVKGQEAAIVGALRIDTWQKDGEWHSRPYVSATSVQFGSKPNNTNNNSKPDDNPGSAEPPAGSEPVEEIPF
jgi:single-strand DNA-binding protein